VTPLPVIRCIDLQEQAFAVLEESRLALAAGLGETAASLAPAPEAPEVA
jgi:hypothetical protein